MTIKRTFYYTASSLDIFRQKDFSVKKSLEKGCGKKVILRDSHEKVQERA